MGGCGGPGAGRAALQETRSRGGALRRGLVYVTHSSRDGQAQLEQRS